MQITNKEYSKMVDKASPPSKKVRNCLMAFIFGGAICTIGQGLSDLYKYWGLDQTEASTAVSITLIGLAAFLTALGIYDKIARIAGAGTVVPITGFANSVVSPAMEFKQEGHILGIGAKMFTIAGPVIVFGVISSVVYGIIYWVVEKL